MPGAEGMERMKALMAQFREQAAGGVGGNEDSPKSAII